MKFKFLISKRGASLINMENKCFTYLADHFHEILSFCVDNTHGMDHWDSKN